jgi:hypothetical protein
MSSLLETPNLTPKNSKGIPVIYFIGAAVLLFGLSGAALFLAYKIAFSKEASTKRVEQALAQKEALAELNKRQADDEAKFILSREEQEEMLRTVRDTTNKLYQTLAILNDLRPKIQALKTNDLGRRVALKHDLVAEAVRVFECDSEELPSQQMLVNRVETSKRFELELLDSLGNGSPPEPDFSQAVKASFEWADNQAKAATKLGLILRALDRDAKAQFTVIGQVASLPTLAEAVSLFEVDEAAADLRGAINTEGDNHVSLLASARTEVRHLDERTAMDLREKAQTAEVRVALAAFLQPGYYVPFEGARPNRIRRQHDKLPMSLSTLSIAGALAPTFKGLKAFIAIGSDPNNDRPTLRREYQASDWYQSPDLYDEAKSLQKLMIELGPTFVDLDLMQK